MLSKIGATTFNAGVNTIKKNLYQRNLQQIEVTSAYIRNRLYHRCWDIKEFGKRTVIKQNYNAGHPIKGSKSKFEIIA